MDTVWHKVHCRLHELLSKETASVIIWTNKNIDFTPFSKFTKRNLPQMFPLIFDLQPVGGFHPSTDAIRTMFSLRWLCPPDHPDSPNQSPWLLTLNWPLTLTISNNDNCFFLPTIQPQFLYHILVNIWHVTAFVQETINLQTSLPMFQNERNSTQGNTPLCMFLHCFIRTGLVLLCQGCVSLPLHGPRSYFLLVK